MYHFYALIHLINTENPKVSDTELGSGNTKALTELVRSLLLQSYNPLKNIAVKTILH